MAPIPRRFRGSLAELLRPKKEEPRPKPPLPGPSSTAIQEAPPPNAPASGPEKKPPQDPARPA